MHLGRDLGVFQRLEVDHAAFDVNGVVFGLGEKGGRSVGAHGELGRERFQVVLRGEIGGIDEDGEIGAATDFVSVVHGVVSALVEIRAGSGGEMASGGESEHTDALGVDLPFASVVADEADGALGVLEGRGVARSAGAGGHTVLEQGAVDADGVEPAADLGAFEVEGEDVVASAWKDDHGGAGILLFGSAVEREGGGADVAEANQRFAGNQIVGGLGGVVLGADGAGLARRAVRPNRDRGGGERGPGEEEEEDFKRAACRRHGFGCTRRGRVFHPRRRCRSCASRRGSPAWLRSFRD